jgi:hypothetical protein
MRAEYVWEEVYKAALVETDDGKLPNRIQAAKVAIDNRLYELQMDHGGTPEERQALSDALAGLMILRREPERRSSEERSSEGYGRP